MWGPRVREVFENYRSRIEVVADEIQVSGEIAFTRRSFRLTLTPRGGRSTQIVAWRYLEIWRKEQGRGLVVRTMDNVK